MVVEVYRFVLSRWISDRSRSRVVAQRSQSSGSRGVTVRPSLLFILATTPADMNGVVEVV